jgi:hypothetical protein
MKFRAALRVSGFGPDLIMGDSLKILGIIYLVQGARFRDLVLFMMNTTIGEFIPLNLKLTERLFDALENS